jgi:hypothetical protein
LSINNGSSEPNPKFVSIFAGPSETKPFKIHLDAIVHYSPYFGDASTNKENDKAQGKAIKL